MTHDEATSTIVAEFGVLSDSGSGDAVAKLPKAKRVEMAVNIYMIQSVYVTVWPDSMSVNESDRSLRSDKRQRFCFLF